MKQAQGLPELLVTLGRRRLNETEVSLVQSIQVTSILAAPTQCILVLRGDDSRAAAVPDAATGDALQVSVGGQSEPLFLGEVTVVEYGFGADFSREVRLRAYDAMHRLRKRQFTRLHDNVDLQALASALVDGTGLSVAGDGTAQLGAVYQVAESDLELLVSASARVGIYPVVTGGALRLVGLGGEGDPLDLELGASLHSVEVEVSQEPAFRSATVSAWSTVDATESGSTSSNSRARAAVRADASPASVGGGGALLRQNEVASDAHLPGLLAQAELDVRGAGEVSASIVAEGDPRLRAGTRVRLRGVSAELDGTYPVCSAVHTINGSGYETVISTRPPTDLPARPPDQVALGVVTDVADPDGRARVRIQLPAIGGLTTAWAPCVVAGAGPSKGAVVLPAVGDTVLAILVAGDPAEAIVLGGLYGLTATPDEAEKSERGGLYTISTSDGQRVVLDTTAKTTRLTDGHGSVVELGPDLLRITAATDLLLEAPGRAMRIRAKSVDFEEAS